TVLPPLYLRSSIYTVSIIGGLHVIGLVISLFTRAWVARVVANHAASLQRNTFLLRRLDADVLKANAVVKTTAGIAAKRIHIAIK
ncbi:MAG: hypothetical protein P4L87_21065, partial [Formivibrio sp.]|nr:hypothetical protein [Formivibrio sp.]